MRTSRKRQPAGFTIVELVIAMTVALLIFGSATVVMEDMNNFRRFTSARLALERDGELMLSWMRRDAAGVGAGSASGSRVLMGIGNAVGTGFSGLLPGIMNIENSRTNPAAGSLVTDKFLLITDIPRPDTNYDGFGVVTGGQLSGANFPNLPIMTEMNGNVTATGVSTRSAAILSDATTVCSGITDPGCPWARRKYSNANGANHIQVVLPNNTWTNARVSGFDVNSASNPIGGHVINLANGGLLSRPNAPWASGRVIQIDRVGYKYITDSGVNGPGVIQRRQCWGLPEPDLSGFGDFGAGCTSNEDTGWQTVARNVTSTAPFDYVDGSVAGTATTSPSLVRGLNIAVILERPVRVGRGSKKISIQVRERLKIRDI